MCRISTPVVAAAAELFSRIKKMAGSVPNSYVAIDSLQPAALGAVLNAEAVLTAGSPNTQDIEPVKPTASAATGCHYSVAAHSQLAGLRPDAIRNIRGGQPTGDAKRDALVSFIGTLEATSGTISGGATAPAETRAASPAADEVGWTLAEVLTARRARERERERARWEPRDWEVRVTVHEHSAIEGGCVVHGTHVGAAGRD